MLGERKALLSRKVSVYGWRSIAVLSRMGKHALQVSCTICCAVKVPSQQSGESSLCTCIHTHILHERKAVFGWQPHHGHQCCNILAPEREKPLSFSLLTHYLPFAATPGIARTRRILGIRRNNATKRTSRLHPPTPGPHHRPCQGCAAIL